MNKGSQSINEALAPFIKLSTSDESGGFAAVAEVFRAVLDYALETIVIIDKEGTILYVNRYDSDSNRTKLIGSNYFTDSNQMSTLISREIVEQVFSTGAAEIYQQELGTGTEKKFFSSTVNPLIRNESVYAVTIISRDITHEVLIKQEAEESKERLELALSGGEVGIWELDLNTLEVECDQLVIEMCGLENFDGTYASFVDRIHHEDIQALQGAIEEAKLTNEPFEVEYRILIGDETIFILVKAKLIKDARNNKEKVLGVCQDITHLRREELGAMNAIINAQEMERERLGKEIHDGIGQLLSAARMNLNGLSMEIQGDADIMNHLEKVKTLVSEAVEEARNISHALVPGRVRELGLKESIEGLCDSYQNAKPQFVFESNHKSNQRYDSLIELNFYRIAQELISNAVKHADATEIFVRLDEIDDRLELEVRDDGCGLDDQYSKKRKGIGLNNVISRVNYLNGQIVIDTVPGKGTSIKVDCVPELIEKTIS